MAWITPKRREAIYLRDNYTCGYCGRKRRRSELTLDHVVPQSRWTSEKSCNRSRNLVTACRTCNCRKGDRTLVEYVNWLVYEGYRFRPAAMIARVNKFKSRSISKYLKLVES